MKQTATVTQKGKADRTTFVLSFCLLFFFDWVICVGIKPQRHDWLPKPPCSAPHEKTPCCEYVQAENPSGHS